MFLSRANLPRPGKNSVELDVFPTGIEAISPWHCIFCHIDLTKICFISNDSSFSYYPTLPFTRTTHSLPSKTASLTPPLLASIFLPSRDSIIFSCVYTGVTTLISHLKKKKKSKALVFYFFSHKSVVYLLEMLCLQNVLPFSTITTTTQLQCRCFSMQFLKAPAQQCFWTWFHCRLCAYAY